MTTDGSIWSAATRKAVDRSLAEAFARLASSGEISCRRRCRTEQRGGRVDGGCRVPTQGRISGRDAQGYPRGKKAARQCGRNWSMCHSSVPFFCRTRVVLRSNAPRRGEVPHVTESTCENSVASVCLFSRCLPVLCGKTEQVLLRDNSPRSVPQPACHCRQILELSEAAKLLAEVYAG